MNFKQFRNKLNNHFVENMANGVALFAVDVDKEALWNLYLDSFPAGTNEVYRERRYYDCSCCRHFVKQFGNVVAINDDYQAISLWDFEADDEFVPVVNALSDFMHNHVVSDVFVTKEGAFGAAVTYEQLVDGIKEWNHFRIDLPTSLVCDGHKTIGAVAGQHRDTRNVLQRSFEEISEDSVLTVLDLIAENSLYRGEEWHGALNQFLTLHQQYHSLPADLKNNYCWVKSVEVGGAVGRIRNHSIGVLLQDISNGTDVVDAVKRYENIVAPQNYKRPKEIFTKRMVEQAEETAVRLGIVSSLKRRFAHLRDVSVNDVLWANRSAKKEMQGIGVFDALKQDVGVDPTSFKNVPTISIDEFMETLQNASTIELLFENRHENNLVSLLTSQDADAKPLFKWGNNTSWAYNGNVTDSLKERVKSAGGRVDGVLRFSIQWNVANDNPNDYDAHCEQPSGHIYYANKHTSDGGDLDVDIIVPHGVAVENITWPVRNRMKSGVYSFYVHCFSHRGGTSGFDAEIEYNGQVREYTYHQNIPDRHRVLVARIELTANGIKFIESLPSTTSTKTVWGLETNKFHQVSTIMLSPNYWNGRSVGNKHTIFTLAGCTNDGNPNGFYNEFLPEELMEHKRVFAALGSKMRVEDDANQLSGLGFSSTTRNSVIARVDNKVYKIVF
jgi:hypothetical protein